MTKTLYNEFEKAVNLSGRTEIKPYNIFYKITEKLTEKKNLFCFVVVKKLIEKRFKFSAYETNIVWSDYVDLISLKVASKSSFEEALDREAKEKEDPSKFKDCMTEIANVLKMTFWHRETESWSVKHPELLKEEK